jgi:TRAP-type C4-dicarboxylate transport system permease small subunit
MTQAGRKGLGRWIEVLAQTFAFLGGAVLVAMTLMSVASIIGRVTLGSPVQGDFELVQVGCAVSLAAFLPWCQLRRANIIVDFFTTGLPQRAQSALDAVGALLVTVVMVVVCWRTAAGMQSVKAAGETTMIIGLPIWYGYAAMVPSFALTALAGAYGALESLAASRGARA